MTESIVDWLEIVHVDEQDEEWLTRRSPDEQQHSLLICQLRFDQAIAVGIPVAQYPLGGRRQSPTSGSHRTQRADFPHWARQKLIYSMAIACSSR